MIRAALWLEVRTLARSPLRLLVLIGVLGTGVFAIAQGERDVARWRTALESARAEQEESRVEALDHLESGRPGPEDRPWVDLTKPLWQDWYAATRLVREPAPLAGIAFASLQTDAVAVRISRLADPLLPQGANIDNPELVAAGGFDLVAVLALLLPLMILALGVDVGGHERASGILPLIRVQSGRDRSWLCARCCAIGILAGAIGLVLVIAAAVVANAGLGTSVMFAGLVIVYVGFWTTLLASVALVARHPSQGAVALGAAWIVLCVVIPAIGVERAAALSADDFALDLTVEARDAEVAHDGLQDDSVMTLLAERWPSLEERLPDDPSSVSFVEREGLGVIALEERMDRREELDRAQTDLVDRMSLASPAVAFTRALEGLAGRDAQPAVEHRRAVVGAVADRVERHIARTWAAEPLGVEDFEELLASTPESVRSSARWPSIEFVIVIGWTIALAALAGLLTRNRPGSVAATETLVVQSGARHA